MAKMSIDDVLNNKYLTDSSLAQQLVAGTLSLDDQIIKDHIHQLGAYQEIYNPGPEPVGPASNEIWYTTSDGEMYDLAGIIERLIIAGTTYNGPAVVSNKFDEEKQMWCLTFDGDVTILGDIDEETMIAGGPFFVIYPKIGLTCNVKNIILPKTVTRIGAVAFFNCVGLTSITIPNSVTSIGYGAFFDCVSLTSVIIGSGVTSIAISAFFVGNDVQGEPAYPGSLQTITVVGGQTYDYNKEEEFTITLANGTDVTLNMWLKEPGADVTIEHEDGTSEIVSLNPNETYSEQGYNGYYESDMYNSETGETADDYLVDDKYPEAGATIYDYCNDSYNPEVTVTIEHEAEDPTYVSLNPNETYNEQGYNGYYSSNAYDSFAGESAEDHLVDNDYPSEGETIYDYCNDTAEPEEPAE